MNFIKYLFLAIIQGFTEPIPISSSGHLVIIKNLINNNNLDNLNLEIILNFGSLIAILIYFREEIIDIVKDFFKYFKTKGNKSKVNARYVFYIIIATIPAGIVGVLLKDKVELISENLNLIGIALLVTALFLFLIKDIKGSKDKKEISIKDAIVIGLFQVVALIPGISRSGATIVGGMSRDLKRDVAFKFSFMLYIPISLATMVLGVKDLVDANLSIGTWGMYLICMGISAVLTYYSTKLFESIMKNGKLIYFSIYCLIVGMLVIIFM